MGRLKCFEKSFERRGQKRKGKKGQKGEKKEGEAGARVAEKTAKNSDCKRRDRSR